MKKAMLIVTRECHRHCRNCCNDLPANQKYWNAADVLHGTDDISCLAGYDEVRLTGGEPLLYEETVGALLHFLRNQNKDQDLYLYTSICTPHVENMLTVLQGVTFSMHHPLKVDDHIHLHLMHNLALRHQDVSFRLSIDPAISAQLPIYPTRWSQIKTTPMLEECPPPADTDIYLWEGLLR